MDIEQLEKRVNWLDEERSKDKALIGELESRLLDLEARLASAEKKGLGVDSDLTRLRTSVTRVDDFEADLADYRLDRKKEIKDTEKQVKSWIADAKKLLRGQIQSLETGQKKLADDFKRVKELEKQMEARIEEETRFNSILREIEKVYSDVQKDYKEYQRYHRTAQEERQKEVKRMTDLQGEQVALRKRVDEMRGLLDLVNSDYQKIKNRIQELESMRREFRSEQDAFLESAALQNAERENTWKSWLALFENIKKQTQDLDEYMTRLDTTHRGVKRMQEELQDLSALLNRRVNEITEMQRLADEKFRAEWNTFTADDQKRWKNYTLSQKEGSKLLERQVKESEERLTLLEDGLQDLEDKLGQISKYSENQLQGLLKMMREWAGEFEQIMDGFR